MGADALRSRGLNLVHGEPVTERARAVKSAEKLALVRASMAVCDQACDAMRTVHEPGVTENALWAKLHEAKVR